MRTLTFCGWAWLVLFATGCSGSPSSPTVNHPLPQIVYPTSPSSGNAPQVTMTLVGGNGPAGCPSGSVPLGTSETHEIAVAQDASSIQLILDPRLYPTDNWGDYEGTVTGASVSLSGRYFGDSGLCGGGLRIGMVDYGVPTTFTGTLSEDGGLLSGHEIRTVVHGPNTYTYEYDWRAALK